MDGSIKVLLVEDDLDLADLVRERLCKFNPQFVIETVASGGSCLTKLTEEGSEYDAIILDYQLPEFNSLEVLETIEKNSIDTPVVVVSGQKSEQIAIDVLKRGAYDYIVKDASYLSVLPKAVQKTIEKHHLETQLRESEYKYRHIFEKANDSILIINPLTFVILEANIITTEMSGYGKSELIGMQFMDLYPEDQKSRAKDLITQAVSDGAYRDDSLSINSKNGAMLPVDINASIINLSNYQYVLGILRNIADKKELQSLILNSKKKLQNTFDGITDIIYQVNRDYEILTANKAFAEFCGSKPENLIGKKCYSIYFDGEEPCVDCPVKATFESPKPKTIEKSKLDNIFEIRSYPVYSDEGQIESVVVYSKNITEKKKLEKSLIQSEKLATIGLLASGISHEIRNPLNIIETARYYLEEYLDEQSPDIKQKFEIIRKNVRRASNIINNLLDFSRNSENEQENINLNKLIHSTISLFGKELTANNIELQFNRNQECFAYFNVDSLKQVLLNMVVNATQAMPNGGKLSFQIKNYKSETVDIKISDTGIGIPEKNLPNIFTPFFTTKEVGIGTGLGLYISQMIIERDGGKISVESVVNAGTTFTISLPTRMKT